MNEREREVIIECEQVLKGFIYAMAGRPISEQSLQLKERIYQILQKIDNLEQENELQSHRDRFRQR